jgi:hypothetical protein
MDTMISMNIIRRAGVFIAVAVMVSLAALAASGCGRATTATGTTTNGLEKKSAADVLQEAAAALNAAKSVHVVLTTPSSAHVDVRMQGDSSTGTVTQAGVRVKITITGGAGYVKTGRAGLKMIGAPQPVQRHDAGRWVKVPTSGHDFTGLTLASFAAQLTAYNGPLEPVVRQAALYGRKVVIVSWRDGSQMYVANTGPAYPLRAEFKGQHPASLDFTEYGARFHITAPHNAESTASTISRSRTRCSPRCLAAPDA